MRQKLCLFLLSIFLVATPYVFAEETKGTDVSGSTSVDIVSNYVWRGFKLSNSLVVQPSVGITYGSFGANFWANYDADLNEHNETDLTLNYTVSTDKFSIDAGYIYYALEGADDTQEVYISVSYDTLLSPTLALYYDFDEGEGGFITASVGHDIGLAKDVALSLGASASYNLDNEYSIGDFTDFHNGEVSASVSVPVSKGVSIGAFMAYTFPLSNDAEDAIEAVSDDSDSSIFYGGINMALSF